MTDEQSLAELFAGRGVRFVNVRRAPGAAGQQSRPA